MASAPLLKNGIAYVTARTAAPGAGISADYITKLCRKGEVDAVPVGNTWYVNEASLAAFVARKEAAKKAQAELNAQQLKEVARRAQAAEQQPQQHPSISLAQQLLNDKAARAAAFAHREAKYRLPRPNAIALATITLLVATSAAALGSDTLRAHMATAAQLPHRLATAAATAAASATSLVQQLPSAKPAQLAQAQTSLAQTLTQKIRNFFCRFITGCTTGSLAAGTPPTRANSATTSRKLDESASNIGYPHDATKSENVNPAASSPAPSTPQTSPSDIARSAPTTPVVGSSASASASPSAVAFKTKPPPQPDTVAAKPLTQNPGTATSPLIQYVAVGGITQQLLESRLAQLESVLSARIQSASLASAYQSTRSSDNVGDNFRNLSDGYALAFDTNALSADAATLGALSVTSNATIANSLSVTDDASVGGDLTVAGTITGGTLAVSGLSSGGAVAAPYFTATSTQATSTFAGGISALGPAQFANSANFFATTAFGATGTTTIATDGTIQTPGISAQNATAASATLAALTSYSATAGALSATSSLSLPYLSSTLLSTDSSGTLTATTSLASSYLAAIDKGFFFATTSADFWQTERNFFSTTSTAYFVSVNQGSLFSTTSAIHFVHSSTTIPKTYTANAFTALQSFNAGLALPSLTNSLLATDGSGNVIATSTLASSLLSLPSGYTFRGNTSNLAEATSTLFVASSGNVGVGMTSPSQRLDVNGIIQTNNYFRSVRAETIGQPAFVDLNNSSGQSLTLKYAEEAISAIPADVWQFRIGGATRDILFSLFDSTPLLMIKGNGNVGIGTTTPGTKLDVYAGAARIQTTPTGGSSFNAPGLLVQSTVTLGMFADFRGNTRQRATLNVVSGWSLAGNGPILNVSNNISDGLLLVDSIGNIGIGTTTPGAKLDVYSAAAGSSSGTKLLNLASNYLAGGTNGAGGYISFTDTSSGNEQARISSLVTSGNRTGLAFSTGVYSTDGVNEAMRITGDGNVGIGTTSPSEKLEVNGQIKLSGTNSYVQLGPNNTLYSVSDKFYVTDGGPGGGVKFAIDNATGNVGIGTTTPSAKLEISDSLSQAVGATLTNTSTGTGALTRLFLRNDGSTGGGQLQVGGTGYTGIASWQDSLVLNSDSVLSGGIKIRAATGGIKLSASGTEANDFYINSSGSVGIGTTSPSQALEVVGTARVTNSTQFGGLHVHNGTNLIADIKGFAAGNDNGVLQLYNGGTISARVMASGSSYFNGGNIGIGTTTPDTALTIHNASVPNANGQNVLKLQGAITAGTIGSGPRIVFTSTGASSGLEVADIRAYTFGASNTGLTFGTGGGGTITTRMAIDGSGNVGIGTTSPWKTLSVVGTMSVNGLTLNTGAASASLCLSSSNEVTRNTDNESCITSSARYKHDIQSLVGTTTLSTLLALRPVSFEYNETPGIRYGLIAEEVDAIDPTLVGYDDEGKPNSVRYTSVIPLLIQAVQEITNITGQSKQNLIAWLADAQNGITDLFAKHLHAENITADTGTFGTVSADRFEGQEVCAKASGGSLVCLTADQFAAMLSQFAGAAAATSGASSPSNIPTPPAQNPEQEDGQTDDATASETNNTTTQNPSPDSAPDLTDSAQSPAANWTPEEPANDNNPSPDASGDSPPPVSNAPGSTPSSTAGTASSPTVANDNAPSPTESAI